MAKNRKYQSASLRFGPAIKACLLCVLIGGSGVGYVWQKSQIDQLGTQISQRELRLRELVKQNDKLKRQLASMHSPTYLESRIKDLGLVLPQPSQVWPVESPPNPAGPGAERQYAQQNAP